MVTLTSGLSCHHGVIFAYLREAPRCNLTSIWAYVFLLCFTRFPKVDHHHSQDNPSLIGGWYWWLTIRALACTWICWRWFFDIFLPWHVTITTIWDNLFLLVPSMLCRIQTQKWDSHYSIRQGAGQLESESRIEQWNKHKTQTSIILQSYLVRVGVCRESGLVISRAMMKSPGKSPPLFTASPELVRVGRKYFQTSWLASNSFSWLTKALTMLPWKPFHIPPLPQHRIQGRHDVR